MNVNSGEVWIVDHDSGSQFLYRDIFGLRHPIRIFESGEAFLDALGRGPRKRGDPALVIGELRTGGGVLLEFLRSDRGREVCAAVPVVVASAVDDVDIIRRCFELGVADFITKPFSPAEMIVKIERILARAGARGPIHPPLSLDPASLTAAHGDARTPALTTREFQILSLIWEFGHGSVDRVEIIQRIWGDLRVGSKTLDVHLSNLRKKLACVGLRILRDRMGALRLEPAEPGVTAQAASGGLPEPPPLL